jgi:hypothetical protein
MKQKKLGLVLAVSIVSVTALLYYLQFDEADKELIEWTGFMPKIRGGCTVLWDYMNSHIESELNEDTMRLIEVSNKECKAFIFQYHKELIIVTKNNITDYQVNDLK